MARRSRYEANGVSEIESSKMQMRDVKVCLLGDSGVGKSSLVMRFVNNTYMTTMTATVGASFMNKSLIVNGMGYKFQIWDTAGQEKFRALAPMYYRGAAAAVIVYDVSKEKTFKSVKSWVHELRSFGPQDIVIAIAGNKCDLEDLRDVQRKDAEEYARTINAIFCETSALTAVNVGELFTALAQQLPPEDFSQIDKRYGSTIALRSQDPARKKSCCGGSRSKATPNADPTNRQSQIH